LAEITEAEVGATPWRYGNGETADGRFDAAKVREEVARTATDVHEALAAPDHGAASLAQPSLRAARWICWLAEPAGLERQLATLRRAARLARVHDGGKQPRRVRLELYDIAPLVRGRHGQWSGGRRRRRLGDGRDLAWSRLVAHQGFVDAPDEVLEALLRVGLGATGVARTLLRDYARGEAFRGVRSELEVVLPRVAWAEDEGPGATRAGGHVHDLDAAFARVNAAYFGGRMARPSLRWSRRPNERKLGHYDFTQDEVVLSVRLDAPDVPRMVVDFVVYHELLHKQHGLRVSGSRRLAHTAAFRRDERRFADYEAVEAWMAGMGRGRVD
jgi:hypothetical protein